MSSAMVWIWRVIMTVIVAFGVWGVWWQAAQLELLNAELIRFVDSIDTTADVTE